MCGRVFFFFNKEDNRTPRLPPHTISYPLKQLPVTRYITLSASSARFFVHSHTHVQNKI